MAGQAFEDLSIRLKANNPWQTRQLGLLELQNLVRLNKIDEVRLKEHLGALVPHIISALKDLRATLFIEACKTVSSIGPLLRTSPDALTSLISPLMKSLQNTKLVFSSTATETLQNLTNSLGYPCVGPIYLNYCQDNHPVTRWRCLALLNEGVACTPREEMEGMEGHKEAIAKVLPKKIEDASKDVREQARLLFSLVVKIWPDLEASIKSQCSNSTIKYLSLAAPAPATSTATAKQKLLPQETPAEVHKKQELGGAATPKQPQTNLVKELRRLTISPSSLPVNQSLDLADKENDHPYVLDHVSEDLCSNDSPSPVLSRPATRKLIGPPVVGYSARVSPFSPDSENEKPIMKKCVQPRYKPRSPTSSDTSTPEFSIFSPGPGQPIKANQQNKTKTSTIESSSKSSIPSKPTTNTRKVIVIESSSSDSTPPAKSKGRNVKKPSYSSETSESESESEESSSASSSSASDNMDFSPAVPKPKNQPKVNYRNNKTNNSNNYQNKTFAKQTKKIY
eukprot:TRINITY_DN90_c0_g1_i1.p1 TRINITY_DN90_c0_g1~~TRINITY_DN90_c0_g1_i1.p1  ORF type:complete len:509 (-),score=143.29 TRINITY_DN90_c0_g1_i1:34-1560(-)